MPKFMRGSLSLIILVMKGMEYIDLEYIKYSLLQYPDFKRCFPPQVALSLILQEAIFHSIDPGASDI